jgi:Zn-dependent protease
VGVRPGYFYRPKQYMALVAAAGPATNFLIALVCAAVLVHGSLVGRLGEVVFLTYMLNLVLGIFNLLPIPPLDGSRIVGAFMSDYTYSRWSALDQYGMFAIFGIIIVFGRQFSTLFVGALEASSDVMRMLVGG